MEVTELERRTPQQNRSIGRRQKILDAAQELVTERGGIDGVTTRTIADRAKVPIGSVYYQFPNVVAIYYALLTALLANVHAETRVPRTAFSSWEAKIDAAIDRMMQHFWSSPIISVLWRALRHEPDIQELNEADNTRWEGANRALLREVLPHLDDERLHIMARAIVRISECLLSETLSTDDPKKRALIAGELKLNLRAYVSAHVQDTKDPR